MASLFKNITIRQRVFFVIGLTTTVALLLAFAAFFTQNFLILTEKQRNKLLVLARVLAINNEAALAFDDKTAAEDTLAALRAEPHIDSAGLYDVRGQLFARYGEGPLLAQMPRPRDSSVKYRDGYYEVIWPVYLQGDFIGTLYLRADVVELINIFTRFILAGFLIILVSGLIAFFVAARLQRNISEPVLQLSQLARRVSTQRDYGLRASKINEDEIGNLVESFNEMLTEIQKRDQALVRSNHDLEQFAYVASHDLQEPLRMVSSFADLLSETSRGRLDPESDQYITYVREGAVRASTLIRDLLEYSRARSQSHPMGTVDLEKVFADMTLTFKVLVRETGAEITHDPLPVVTGDKLKLPLLFQNLIGNALKFRHPDRVPKVHVSGRRMEDQWLFSVRDNGIGIEPRYADRVFVIFQRLHARKVYEGTGIGLAICKSIVESHNGRIWVESIPGEGSTFFFTLALNPGENRP